MLLFDKFSSLKNDDDDGKGNWAPCSRPTTNSLFYWAWS